MPDDATSTVTLHMVASLDGFVARIDGSVDWLEAEDAYPDGKELDPATVESFLASIDCYVMGSRTYQGALRFDAEGSGWPYGDTPTWVLTKRALSQERESVHLHDGDVVDLIAELRARHRNIWVVGGGALATACMREGLIDEIRYGIVPIVIGGGVPYFGSLPIDVPLHLVEVEAYTSGMVELRYQVKRSGAS